MFKQYKRKLLRSSRGVLLKNAKNRKLRSSPPPHRSPRGSARGGAQGQIHPGLRPKKTQTPNCVSERREELKQRRHRQHRPPHVRQWREQRHTLLCLSNNNRPHLWNHNHTCRKRPKLTSSGHTCNHASEAYQPSSNDKVTINGTAKKTTPATTTATT